jgi:hypothetical protein
MSGRYMPDYHVLVDAGIITGVCALVLTPSIYQRVSILYLTTLMVIFVLVRLIMGKEGLFVNGH